MAIVSLHSRTGSVASRPVLQDHHVASRAFTLVEVLLALAFISVVGLLVTMLLASLGAATQAQHDSRRTTMERELALTRLGVRVRSAAAVLAVGENHLVLWTGDANRNGKPDLSELRRIDYDADSKKIWVSEAPSGLASDLDETYELDSDFSTITASISSESSTFPRTLMSRRVHSWAIHLNDEPTSASIVRIDMRMKHHYDGDIITIIAALRGL